MKKLKRTLALALVVCMLCSYLPVGALAAESDIGHMATKPANGTTTGSPFPKGTAESTSFRIPAIVTLSDGTLLAAADARWNTTYDGGGHDTIVSRSTDGGATWSYTFANYLGDNGNAYNGGSTCFIDPSLAVLTTDENNDGVGEDTIFMLCDLYPTGVAINGNKQIVPNYSTGFNADGYLKLTAATLNSTGSDYDDTDFTHYLKDGKIYANDGTVVDGLTVDAYFNVAGTYNNQTVDSNLFFADSPFKVARTGYLYLTKSTDGGESWSAPQLLNLKTNQEMVCLVGPNGGMVTSEGVIVFPVYSYTGSAEYTGLIYSKDGGNTWQRSTNLTAIDSSEADAVELDNGNLRVFFRNETSFLCYADFDLTTGTWVTQTSGFKYVNTQVFCNSNTELSAITYSQSVTHNGVEKSVILVSCPASANLAGSTSSDGSWRTSGRIFAGLVDPETYEMTWLDNSAAVTPVATGQLSGNYTADKGFFAYSSMTQKYESGDLAILYEDNQYGWGAAEDGSNYYTIAYKTITESELENALGITFSDDTDIHVPGDEGGDVTADAKSVELKVGESTTETIADIYVEDGRYEDDYVTVTWDGTEASTIYATATLGTDANYTGDTIDVAKCLYTFTASGNGFVVQSKSDPTLYLNTTKNAAGCPNANVSNTVIVNAGNGTNTFYLMCSPQSGDNTTGNGYLYFWHDGKNRFDRNSGTSGAEAQCSFYLYRPAEDGETGSSEIPGYVRVTDAYNAIADGDYLIAHEYNGAYFLLHPSTTTSGNDAGRYPHVAKVTGQTAGTDSDASTTVTITAKKIGETTVEIGNGAITYNVTVTTADFTEVLLKVGETKTYTDKSANYANSTNNIMTNAAIAGMELNGMDDVFTSGSFVNIDALTAGNYIIKNSRAASNGAAGYLVSNTPNSTTDNNGLKLEGSETSFGKSAVWTITPSGDGYTIQDVNGKYMTIGNSTASVVDESTVLTLTYTSGNMKYAISKDGYYLNQFGGGTSVRAAGWNGSGAATDDGSKFEIYQFTGSFASTGITFTGVTPGTTTAVVGDTTYKIIVSLPEGMTEEKVELKVGESKTYTDNSGVYTEVDATNLNSSIATVQITGSNTTYEKTITAQNVTEIVSGKTYVFYNKVAQKLMSNEWADASVGGGGSDGLSLGSTTDNFDEHDLWTVTATEGGFYVQDQNGKYMSISRGKGLVKDEPVVINLDYDGTDWTIGESGEYANDFGGAHSAVAGWSDINDTNSQWEIYEVVSTPVGGSTEVTIKGISEGKTSAIVGNTLYNITVTPSGLTVVDITVEVGESFTFTDLTGNHADKVTQEPDSSKAIMSVAGVENTYQKSLVHVTALTFDPNKQYVIENVQAKTNQPECSVLTAETATYTLTGLVMNGPVDVNTSQTWTFTSNYDNNYYITYNGKYLHADDQNGSMVTEQNQLALTYVAGKGWTIVDDGYYLCDLFGTDSGEAFGTTNASDGGIYWNIYEVVDETTVESTEVTFTGVTAGTTTTAIVGNIQYNITVIAVTNADEILQSAIDFEEGVRVDTFVVEPQYQRERYYDIVDGKRKDLYTDESWKVYETARQAAYKKLTEVINAEYPSDDEAQTDLDALKALIDALKAAETQLVRATTISVKYHVNEVGDTPLDIKEYKITSNFNADGNLNLDGLTVELPKTIVVDGTIYEISNTTLELEGAETYYDVIVTEIGKVGGGFVGSEDIENGYHNDYHQLADLVDDDGVGRKITELTFTTGFSYDLNLATDTTGKTVTWTIGNEDVATVDQEGNVTAVAPGTTYVTATVTENGEVVEVNTIPVTVFQSGTGSRITGLYAEQVDNTTVWCVVNADTKSYSFEVIEGELIYGQFDKAITADNTNTTAISFFGDPDEAHALVLMRTNQAAGDYYLLHDDDGNLYDGTKDGMASGNYYVSGQTTGAGYWQAVGLTNNVTGLDTSGWQLVKDMVQWAINLGCDGGLGFTRRQSEGHLCDNLYFVSDPMARIEKTVDGVLPVTRKMADYKRYVPNMVAAVKEQVYFKLTVTLECPTVWTDADETVSAIVYSDAIIADTVLPGAFLYSKELDNLDGKWDGEVTPGNRKQTDDITAELNAPWTDAEKTAGKRVLEYYLVYEIQESDIPKFWIDNIANLSYDYKSEYSKGGQAGSADAEARISVTGSAIENVVIDFGQSFVYAGHEYTSITDGKTYTFEGLTDAQLKGAFVGENAKATATYGDVTVEKNGEFYTVTYTPHSILQGIDAVQIFGLGENNKEKVINGFLVYPATTVYYEEGFLLNNNGWNTSNAKAATKNQSFEMLGTNIYDEAGGWVGKVSNKKHAYGFDPIYDGVGDDDVVKSGITADTAGATTEFTFTGTGFELFADCTENSGYVNVTVKNADNEIEKIFMVNTVVKGGDTGATAGQTGYMGALPIVSLKDLEHGTYTVTLTKVIVDNATEENPKGSKPVTIDGVRITNTHADSTVYTIDLEDNPEFYQLRNYVMNAINIQDYLGDSLYVDELTEGAKQVFAGINTDSEAPAAILTSVGNIYTGTGDEKAPQDLLDNGPKNEIYLWAGQTLTFKVNTQRVMQVGLKTPSGETTYEITCTGKDAKTGTMAANTDMFYYVVDAPVADTTEYTVSITNTGSKVLAITDLKVCDDPTAAFVPLTEDDVRQILVNSGYSEGSDEPEIVLPFVDVPADSFYYAPVAWAVSSGITNGISATHFGPSVECNRAQAVTFLWRAAGSPNPTTTEHGFVDVAAGSFYEKAVLWAVEKGITTGTDTTHFSPDQICSRSQVVTFLYRAFESPVVENVENPFSDVPADAWYTAPVLWAVVNGITTGTGNGLFDVGGVCNRAQIVTFLYRAYN